jgi:transcriptional regulator with XRE-family HTH domain
MNSHPLKSYRERAGLSLEGLAARVGTSKASLSRIEARLQTPSLGLVERIVGVAGGELTANDFVSESVRKLDEARA